MSQGVILGIRVGVEQVRGGAMFKIGEVQFWVMHDVAFAGPFDAL